MTPEQIDLARALAGVEGFVWSAGMRGWGLLYWKRDTASYKGKIDVMEGKPCVIVKRSLGRGTCEAIFFKEVFPDLNDAATGGVLIEALGWDAKLYTPSAVENTWVLFVFVGEDDERMTKFEGPTLAHACAAALVARGWYRRTG